MYFLSFQAECVAGDRSGGEGGIPADPDIGASQPQHLNELLDHLLHPEKPIDDPETVEWCRSLIGEFDCT